MTDQILIFTYGTLQKQFNLHQKIIHRSSAEIETVEEKVRIKGWGLLLSEQGPYPIAYPNPHKSIVGSIIACNSEQARMIIDIESDYMIKILPVEVNGNWYNCLFFYGYRRNEEFIKSGNFLWLARRHKLPCLKRK